MTTIKFNVGGLTLETKEKNLMRYPSLSKYIGSNNTPIFLDYNPFAFLVILDYIRTNQLCIPRNVSKQMVLIILNELQIPYQDVTESDLEIGTEMLPKSIQAMYKGGDDLPPSYDSQTPSSSNTFREKGNHHSLSEHQTILLKNVHPFLMTSIVPVLKSCKQSGQSKLHLYVVPPGIDPKSIANDKVALEYTIPKEFVVLKSNDFDYKFLLQSDVQELVTNWLLDEKYATDCVASIQNLTCRVQTPFGLYESKSFDLLFFNLKFYS
ncbi:hypothetical protein BC833DRAFT_582577 [Globomyces pollinis-pini]|nr:hypothetical protein BC833DRAFT_582577 [Globomyces pollinis-pini]